MKRLLISISAGILVALLLAQAYSWYQPEIRYFRIADEVSTRWEQELRRENKPCIILGGGSEIRSSISPALLKQEFGLNTVNTGGSAGNGLVVNSAIALHHVRPGDTLLLSVISAHTSSARPSEDGIKLAAQIGGIQALGKGGIPLSPDTILRLLSANARSMLITAVRKMTRGYTFVYFTQATLHHDGWMEVHRRGMKNAGFPKTIPRDGILSPECIETLEHAKQSCRDLGVQFIVMLPASYSNVHETSRRLLHALQITRLGIPVLRDERLGRMTNPSRLADTHAHFNAEGTAKNSRIIGRLLAEKSYWSESELLERLKAPGLAEDGTPLP